MAGDKRSHAVDCFGGDPSAIPQPRGKLAVIDGATAKGGFRQPGLPAIFRNFTQEILGMHCEVPAAVSSMG
jgi:hypothetical protein